MRNWWPAVVVVGLLALVVGLPLAMRPAAAQPAGGAQRLIILSPNDEQIRYEFGRAFNLYRQARGEEAVDFDWRTGGTSDLDKQVRAQFDKIASAGHEDEGIGYDLFFGGGDYEHALLAKGAAVTRDGGKIFLPITAPITLPQGLLKEAFPQAVIGSEPLYDPGMRWVGTALSSFGIVYNRDVLGMIGLPEPTTWADLTDGRYRKGVALADPAHSGSIMVAYNAVLRRLGWETGWSTLRRIYANGRYFTASATKPAMDVSAGEAAAGISIDFYGRFQAGAVSAGRVGYVDPPGMTYITADPISLFRGAPHKALAEEFVAWLLSRQAQGLWQKKAGSAGGPEKFELHRLPIRRDLYDDPALSADWTDRVAPFGQAKAFPKGMPSFHASIADISHAMAIDVHDELAAAWSAILDHPNHPRHAEMLRLFDELPPELRPDWPSAEVQAGQTHALADVSDPGHGAAIKALGDLVARLDARWKDRDQRLRDRQAWTEFFRANYLKIVEMAR